MMRKITVVFLLLVGVFSLQAQTEKYGTWLEVELTKKIFDKFELSFIPEIRWQDDFSVDKYQFDFKLGYEPFEFLSVAAAYRNKTNIKNKENETTNRFVFDLGLAKDLGRFKTSLRTRYTNYNQEDNKRTIIIRPRMKVVYNIKGNKIAPYTSYELFHDIGENEWKKSRFDIGLTRKIGELHKVGLYYRLQNYFYNQNSIHILGIDYRFKI